MLIQRVLMNCKPSFHQYDNRSLFRNGGRILIADDIWTAIDIPKWTTRSSSRTPSVGPTFTFSHRPKNLQKTIVTKRSLDFLVLKLFSIPKLLSRGLAETNISGAAERNLTDCRFFEQREPQPQLQPTS